MSEIIHKLTSGQITFLLILLIVVTGFVVGGAIRAVTTIRTAKHLGVMPNEETDGGESSESSDD